MGMRAQGSKVSSTGAVLVSDNVLRPGEDQLLDRLDVFDGDTGIALATTAGVALRAAPCALVRVRCLTGGTITSIHDNASAASGTQIMASTTMVAGQVIEVGELMANGLYAVVASGTFRVVAPLLAS